MIKSASASIPGSLVSAVILLAFTPSGDVVMVKNPRGWDFPGGHVERGESPEGALHREALEEACITIKDVRLFLSASTENNAGTYAKKCMVFYIAQVHEVLPFLAEYETTERTFITPKMLLTTYDGGKPELAAEVLRQALKRQGSLL